ncbi:MAG: hypothetical protein JRM77_07495 [Nitrososphaerota archaeon]|nr:hypothetical protein [Nitrososphaerota archaeon]
MPVERLQEVRAMRLLRRLLAVGVVLSLIIVSGAVAYTVLSGSASAKVQEPLSVSGVAAMDTSSNTPGTCSQDTCSLTMYAGESGQVTFTLSNAASVTIIPSVTATSSDSTNIPVTVSGIPNKGIAAQSSIKVTISFTASQSTPPETVTITWSVSR